MTPDAPTPSGAPAPLDTSPKGTLRPERPLLVMVLALVSAVSGLYLLVLGGLRLTDSNAISLMSGSALLGELVLRGPLIFLLAGAVFLLNAFGLWRLSNWARLLSIGLAALGAALVLPRAAAALGGANPIAIVGASLAVILRIAVVFYLTQDSTKRAFQRG